MKKLLNTTQQQSKTKKTGKTYPKEQTTEFKLGPIASIIGNSIKQLSLLVPANIFNIEKFMLYAGLGLIGSMHAFFYTLIFFSNLLANPQVTASLTTKYIAFILNTPLLVLTNLHTYLGIYLILKCLTAFATQMLSDTCGKDMQHIQNSWREFAMHLERNIGGLLLNTGILAIPFFMIGHILKAIIHNHIAFAGLYYSAILWGPLAIYACIRMNESLCDGILDTIRGLNVLKNFIKVHYFNKSIAQVKPEQSNKNSVNMIFSIVTKIKEFWHNLHSEMFSFTTKSLSNITKGLEGSKDQYSASNHTNFLPDYTNQQRNTRQHAYRDNNYNTYIGPIIYNSPKHYYQQATPSAPIWEATTDNSYSTNAYSSIDNQMQENRQNTSAVDALIGSKARKWLTQPFTNKHNTIANNASKPKPGHSIGRNYSKSKGQRTTTATSQEQEVINLIGSPATDWIMNTF